MEEAKKNIAEALFMFFRSCFERGTLDAVLKQCGFRSMEVQDMGIGPGESLAGAGVCGCSLASSFTI